MVDSIHFDMNTKSRGGGGGETGELDERGSEEGDRGAERKQDQDLGRSGKEIYMKEEEEVEEDGEDE